MNLSVIRIFYSIYFLFYSIRARANVDYNGREIETEQYLLSLHREKYRGSIPRPIGRIIAGLLLWAITSCASRVTSRGYHVALARASICSNRPDCPVAGDAYVEAEGMV